MGHLEEAVKGADGELKKLVRSSGLFLVAFCCKAVLLVKLCSLGQVNFPLFRHAHLPGMRAPNSIPAQTLQIPPHPPTPTPSPPPPTHPHRPISCRPPTARWWPRLQRGCAAS